MEAQRAGDVASLRAPPDCWNMAGGGAVRVSGMQTFDFKIKVKKWWCQARKNLGVLRLDVDYDIAKSQERPQPVPILLRILKKEVGL